MEAHWENDGPVPLVVLALPNKKAERNDYEIAIPYLGSLILSHSLIGSIPALKDFPPKDRPPVLPIFLSFRVMVGIGLLLIFMAGAGGILWSFGKLDRARLYLLALSWCWPLGFVAIIAGWTTTEVGRQPWVAYGVLRTADAASPIPAISIAVFIVLFVLVYGVVFGAGVRYIRRLIKKGPEAKPADEPEVLANRPISAAFEEGQSPENLAIASQRVE